MGVDLPQIPKQPTKTDFIQASGLPSSKADVLQAAGLPGDIPMSTAELNKEMRGKVNGYIASFDKALVENMPNKYIKALSASPNNRRLYYFLAIMAYLVLLAIFSSFFATGYIAAENASYISLASDSGECEIVGKVFYVIYTYFKYIFLLLSS